MKQLLALAMGILFACCTSASAALKLPFVFSDHAVLQREMPVPVWGTADAGQEVHVAFGGQSCTVTAGADGAWMVKLASMPASAQGRTLTISAGTETVEVKDLLVGEVWLCSGQSNMEKPVGEQKGQKPTVNYKDEIAAANIPELRLLGVPEAATAAGVTGNWQICTPETLVSTRFSAVGYFFGRKIQAELSVPVGMIHSSWGGTNIELWIPPQGYGMVPSLAALGKAGAVFKDDKAKGTTPGNLYFKMIQPLVPYALRGALWYQGENNCSVPGAAVYTDKMRALIGGWRQVWGEGDFPFYYVQLAPYIYSKHGKPTEALPRMWEAQTKALSISNTAMVVTSDLVDDLTNIHPIHKREVGERLAACALARDYGQKNLIYSGPTFNSVTFKDGKAIVAFDDVADGLKSRDDKPLSYFEIAGADGKFVDGDAKINGGTVIVSSPTVPNPKYVRFAWRQDAQPNLINSAGLPAGAFRTDELPAAVGTGAGTGK